MTEDTTGKFIEALERLEIARDLEPICELFSEDCDIANVITEDNHHHATDVRSFWQSYRDNFGEVKSTFRNRIVTEKTAALEWMTEGTSADGETEFEYDGVSILEIDGDRITRFHAYFNPNKLGRQIVETKKQSA